MRAFKLTAMFSLGCVIWLFSPALSHSQDWYTGVTYEMSFPTGDVQNFANGTSFRGIGLGYRKVLDKNTTGGLFFGWNVFHERTSETLQLERGALTGTQDRTVNSFPMMLNAHYYMGNRGDIRPYVGINAGGFIVLQRLAVGIYALQKDSFEWGVAPEVGAVIPVSRELLLLLNGKYNYAFTGKGLAGDDFNLAYWGLNVGFAWQQD